MENIYYYTKSIDIYFNIYFNNVLTQKKNAENSSDVVTMLYPFCKRVIPKY